MPTTLLPPWVPVWMPALLRHPAVVFTVFVACFLVLNDVLPLLTFDRGLPLLVAGPVCPLVASIACYLALTRLLEGRWFTHGFDPRRAGGILGGISLGAGLCLLVFAICYVGGWRTVTGHNPAEPILLPTFAFGVCAAFAEEIVFRGVLFRCLEQLSGTWIATAISGLVFGLMHLSNPHATVWGAVAIGVEAGVGLALLYRLTDSLWWAIGAHGAWNVVQGPILGSAVSGASPNGDGLVISFPTGPSWLSGGRFGLEATPASVLVWGILSVVLAVRIMQTRQAVPAPAARRWWTRRA